MDAHPIDREEFTEQEVLEEIIDCLQNTPLPIFEGEDFGVERLMNTDAAAFRFITLGRTFLVSVVDISDA